MVLKNLKVPTGNILVVDGEIAPLEVVSLGDYGKEKNLIANFMGLNRPIDHVVHQEMLPLTEKWVITISTQTGCRSGCKFCDCPKLGRCDNATYLDLVNQVKAGMSIHPEITRTNRLNVHFARIGEPTWNKHVLNFSRNWLLDLSRSGFNVHPVISTMLPIGNTGLKDFLVDWMLIKNEVYNGNAGLQLSINSTNEDERKDMFSGSSLTLEKIGELVECLPTPKGRKITLNFAVAQYEIDPSVLLRYFSPEHYLIKLTPMHKTASALENDIRTSGDYCTMYPYVDYEESLRKAGYDVLVFIASHEEDAGLITCGNAILTGSLPSVPYEEIQP